MKVVVGVVARPVINPSEIPGIETKNENPIYLGTLLVEEQNWGKRLQYNEEILPASNLVLMYYFHPY